jgi:hypothetical protein
VAWHGFERLNGLIFALLVERVLNRGSEKLMGGTELGSNYHFRRKGSMILRGPCRSLKFAGGMVFLSSYDCWGGSIK